MFEKKLKISAAETAIIEDGAKIGDGSKIWHFSHIMGTAVIGDNCSIGERVFIGDGVIIGDNCKIANGANIYKGAVIRNNVFIGNNVSFTNVKYPRAWRKPREFVPVIVDENVTINANAIVVGGVRIGRNSTVGEGAIVVRDVSEGGFVVSPPAQCLCDRDNCAECFKRKEKNKLRYQKNVEKKQQNNT